MKKLLLAAIVGLSSLLSSTAQAQTATSAFDVVINLQAGCIVSTAADITFNYTAFQAGTLNPTTNFDVTCSTNLPYTIALTTTSTTGTANVTDPVVGLAYSLALSGAGANGSGVAQNYVITGTMVGGQAGTCATATCSNAGSATRNKTVTITY